MKSHKNTSHNTIIPQNTQKSKLSLSLSLSNKIVPSRGFTIVELLIVVVVIAVLAAITIVAYNGITNQAKDASRASAVSQWQKAAAVHRVKTGFNDCPSGYVFVYGNSTLGTNDFCVMKYEAKNDGSGNAVSTAGGTPWVSISQTASVTAATAAGGHLITEAEWMTIAADALGVKHNWSGGEVGSGNIFQGHVNSNPDNPLAASADDTDGLYGITGGIGTTSGTNSQRTLLLSSGETIWDFSGNVWEWTQQAVGVPTHTVSQIGVNGDSAFVWRDYTLGSLSLGNLPAISRPAALTGVEGLGAITGWNGTQGIGRIHAYYADAGARAFRRGGDWSYGSYAGVLALTLSYMASNSNANVGFRVVR